MSGFCHVINSTHALDRVVTIARYRSMVNFMTMFLDVLGSQAVLGQSKNHSPRAPILKGQCPVYSELMLLEMVFLVSSKVQS